MSSVIHDLDDLVTAMSGPKYRFQLMSLRAAVLCGRSPSALRSSFGTGKTERNTPLAFSTGEVNVHFSASRRFFITPAGVDRSECRLVVPARLSHAVVGDDVWSKHPREAKARSICVLFLSGLVGLTGEPIAVDASNLTFSASSLSSLLGCFKTNMVESSVQAALYECFGIAIELMTPDAADATAVVSYGAQALLKAPHGSPRDGGGAVTPAPRQSSVPESHAEARARKAAAAAAAATPEAPKPKRSAKRASK